MILKASEVSVVFSVGVPYSQDRVRLFLYAGYVTYEAKIRLPGSTLPQYHSGKV